MHIGIDISSLMYGRGVSRYTANLVKALAEHKELRLSLYGSSFRQRARLEKLANSLVAHSSNSRVVIQPLPPSAQHLVWNTLGLNSISRSLPGIDVFHSWDWLQPPDSKIPLVSTIHDLAILKFPETAHPNILKMHHLSWKKLKEREAEIIAVSRSTKKDIVELLDIPADKVHVIYEALPAEFKRVSDTLTEDQTEQLKRKLELQRPYIFFVGTREPRKNLARLIEAWRPLAKDVELLIAGEMGWDETSTQTTKSTSNTPQPRFLGKVTDQELAVLYGETEAFVYPCLYEGFGLPILEAFYHGTPVITSNRSSMIEVAGNAAELVEPESVESIQAGISTVLNENLAQQKQRLQKMIIRTQMFNWNRVADETIEVYQRAIEHR